MLPPWARRAAIRGRITGSGCADQPRSAASGDRGSYKRGIPSTWGPRDFHRRPRRSPAPVPPESSGSYCASGGGLQGCPQRGVRPRLAPAFEQRRSRPDCVRQRGPEARRGYRRRGARWRPAAVVELREVGGQGRVLERPAVEPSVDASERAVGSSRRRAQSGRRTGSQGPRRLPGGPPPIAAAARRGCSGRRIWPPSSHLPPAAPARPRARVRGGRPRARLPRRRDHGVPLHGRDAPERGERAAPAVDDAADGDGVLVTVGRGKTNQEGETRDVRS